MSHKNFQKLKELCDQGFFFWHWLICLACFLWFWLASCKNYLLNILNENTLTQPRPLCILLRVFPSINPLYFSLPFFFSINQFSNSLSLKVWFLQEREEKCIKSVLYYNRGCFISYVTYLYSRSYLFENKTYGNIFTCTLYITYIYFLIFEKKNVYVC